MQIDPRTLAALALCGGSLAAAQFGGFGSPVLLPTGAGQAITKAADIDSDGDMDVIVSHTVGGVFILRNEGNEVFTAQAAGGSPAAFANLITLDIRDINNDGHLDIVRTASSGDVEVLMGDGSGLFATLPRVRPTSLSGLQGTCLADLTEDGIEDLVMCHLSVSHLVPGNGDGTFGASTLIANFPSQLDADAADIDGDGDLDLIIGRVSASDRIAVLRNEGTGSFASPTFLASPSTISCVVFGDLNNDTHPDIVAWSNGPGGHRIRVWINDGMGDFPVRNDYYPTNGGIAGAESLVIVDIDGDSFPDVIMEESESTIGVLFNDGAGGLTDPTPYFASSSNQVTSVDAADFDGNGSPDVLVGSWSSVAQPSTALYLLNQTPTLPPDAFSLVYPPDDLGPVPLPEALVWPGLETPNLDWNTAPGFGITYTVTIARDPALTQVVFQQTGITGTQIPVPTGLQQGRNYYWSVTASNPIGDTVSTPVERRFFTRYGTDVDADGDVDFTDLNTLLTDYGSTTQE